MPRLEGTLAAIGTGSGSDLGSSWLGVGVFGLSLGRPTGPLGFARSGLTATPLTVDGLAFFLGELTSSLVLLDESGFLFEDSTGRSSSCRVLVNSFRALPPVFSRIEGLPGLARAGSFSFELLRVNWKLSFSSREASLRLIPILVGVAAGASDDSGLGIFGSRALVSSFSGRGASAFFFCGDGDCSTRWSYFGEGRGDGGTTSSSSSKPVSGSLDGEVGGDSVLTGLSSMNCDMGGGPSSGDSAESAFDCKARICSGLNVISFGICMK